MLVDTEALTALELDIAKDADVVNDEVPNNEPVNCPVNEPENDPVFDRN